MVDTLAQLLRGRRILVVEDDYMLADDLREDLEFAGAEVLGPVSTIEDAFALLAREERLDGAVLDVNLAGEPVYPVADALLARGVRFAFATGYDGWSLPAAYAEIPCFEKPLDPLAVVRALLG